MNLNLVDFIAILGISQGIFLIAILQRNTETNNKANRILSLLLLLSSLLLATKVLIMNSPSVEVYQRLILVEPIIFLYGPLSLYYLKFLMQGIRSFPKKWLILLPTVLYFLLLAFLNVVSKEEFVRLIRSKGLLQIFVIVELLALCHNIYYWYLSNQFLAKYDNARKQQISFHQEAVKYLTMLHYVIGVILVFWIIGFISSNVFGYRNLIFGYNAIWIALSGVIYIVAYFAIKQPEIFKFQKLEKSVVGLQESRSKEYKRLQEDEIHYLESRLNHLMASEKLYLDNSLTLANLAKKLRTTTNNLSWFLNNVYDTNFYDYINEYRINEFIKKIEQREHINRTLLALSMEVGFNSKSTFNKAFKTHRNDTPSNYIKRMNL